MNFADGLSAKTRSLMSIDLTSMSKFFFFVTEKLTRPKETLPTCGLYYKCFMIVIYNRNDSSQYYKTMIVIDNPG